MLTGGGNLSEFGDSGGRKMVRCPPDWTRTSEAKIFRACEEIKTVTPPRVQARGPGGSAPAPAYGGVVTGSRLRGNVPTGLEPARRRFSERARNQKSQPPRMPLLRWTRTRRSLEQAPQRLRMAEWLLVRARGTYIARTPELRSGVLAISAPPTGLEPVTLRLTVECSAN